VALAKQELGLREHDLHALGAIFVPFSAKTRMSGVNLHGREVRKGALDAIRALVRAQGGRCRAQSQRLPRSVPAAAAPP
jgi:K+-transporting ATPase ATPase B chain